MAYGQEFKSYAAEACSSAEEREGAIKVCVELTLLGN